MKIAINNKIIDTTSIFSISEKVSCYYNAGENKLRIAFDIEFFDKGTPMVFGVNIKMYYRYMDALKTTSNMYVFTIGEEQFPIDLTNGLNGVEDILIEKWPLLKKEYEKVEAVRKAVYDIWSNNQSDVPKFKL